MAARYNNSGNGEDNAYAIAVDGSGNVYVTGESKGLGTSYDCATIKYSPNGKELWVKRYNGPGNYSDAANAIAVDGSGNVFVTGLSGWNWNRDSYSDYATIKYSPNGKQLWVKRYNGPGNNNDCAYVIAVDGSGNIYVSGECGILDLYNIDSEIATIKYSPNGK